MWGSIRILGIMGLRFRTLHGEAERKANCVCTLIVGLSEKQDWPPCLTDIFQWVRERCVGQILLVDLSSTAQFPILCLGPRVLTSLSTPFAIILSSCCLPLSDLMINVIFIGTYSRPGILINSRVKTLVSTSASAPTTA